MKPHAALAALLLFLPAIARTADSEQPGTRYVADAMTVLSLPTGEVVTRLVSTNGQTVRQFWVESAYGRDGSLVVFGEQHRTPAPSFDARHKPKSEQHTGKPSDTQTGGRLATVDAAR